VRAKRIKRQPRPRRRLSPHGDLVYRDLVDGDLVESVREFLEQAEEILSGADARRKH
jgi:hypothetical protein